MRRRWPRRRDGGGEGVRFFMQIGALLSTIASTAAEGAVVVQAMTIANEGSMIGISPGTYRAGRVSAPSRKVTVSRGFLTPPDEITNAQVDEMQRAYPRVQRGLFMTDVQEGSTHGFSYLLATGDTKTPVDRFEILPSELLPPSLGIARGQTVEDFVQQRPDRLGGRFKILADAPQQIMPAKDRYDKGLRDVDKFKAPNVAATMINYWQAQALAQLLGGKDLLQTLFGISGMHYVDLPDQDQWGLLAVKSSFSLITSTGRRRDHAGKLVQVKAFHLRHIVPATDYPTLPNGIRPNVVWDWVKDLWTIGRSSRLIRGGSWCRSREGRQLVGSSGGYNDPSRYYGDLGFRVVVP